MSLLLPTAQSFDANVRRNIFAKKLTSLLKEESVTSERTDDDVSKTEDLPKQEGSQVISVAPNSTRKEWI